MKDLHVIYFVPELSDWTKASYPDSRATSDANRHTIGSGFKHCGVT